MGGPQKRIKKNGRCGLKTGDEAKTNLGGEAQKNPLNTQAYTKQVETFRQERGKGGG